MRFLRPAFLTFYKQASRCSQYFEEAQKQHPSSYKQYVFTAGSLNVLWQAWGEFWRHFWLAHLMGGYDIKKQQIQQLYSCSTEGLAAQHVLSIIGRKPVVIKWRSQEPTWGDTALIQKLATRYSGSGQPGTIILSAFSVLGQAPVHLQKIRNAAIHLNHETMLEVKSVSNFYIVPNTIKYPTDILFSLEMKTGKITFKSWKEDILAFLELILGI